MQKILVIGCPGSGKSTFSRELGKKCAITLYHMDLLYWNQDKTTITSSELTTKLNAVMSKDRWIIDGNYLSTLELRLSICDTVFFLDYPLETCLDGIKSRAGKARPDMPWIESPEDTIEMLNYVRQFFKKDLQSVYDILNRSSNISKHVFHARHEAQSFLDQL